MDTETKPLVVFFADVCDSTGMYRSLGDAEASRIVGDCLGVLAAITMEHDGTVIKTIGDEIMAEFPTADLAAEAALAMQTQRRQDDPLIKIGFHMGPVTRRDGDLFGDTVNLASRVVGVARQREILMTGETVMRMSRIHRDRALFFDDSPVKGISNFISLFRYPTEMEFDGTAMDTGEDPTQTGGDPTFPPSSSSVPGFSASAELSLTSADQTVTLLSTEGAMEIGRSQDCRLVVSGRGVSRHHAKISWERDRFVLEDTSSNGTYIARQDETPHLLKRQVLPLFGRGSISLGAPPSSTRDSGIHYSVLHHE